MLVFVITFRKINMIRKVIRIGNSVGITLDKKMLQSLGLDGINEVWVEPDKNKQQIIIRKRTEKDW
jgi:antitoxin component of MazEF toxin-antitoxin module